MTKAVFFFVIEEITSSFEITDIENASNTFEKVVLLTLSENNTQYLPKNVIIHVIDFNNITIPTYKVLPFLGVILAELAGSLKYLRHIKLFRYNIGLFLRADALSSKILELVRQYSKKSERKILYSFWLNNCASALALLSLNRSVENAGYYGRAHGTDLFEERVPIMKRIPFRAFQLKYLDKVVSVSQKGTDYLKAKYPKWAEKVSTSYLGTKNYGVGLFDTNSKFTIISCAKIRNIKRIHLIPKILLNLKFPVRWIHIGGECNGDSTLSLLTDNLAELKVKNPNVEVSLMGDLVYQDVLKLYLQESVNLFLSVSETEGLPVSMMEAISFGVPIMATNVGGCNEIVTNKTGILIDKEFDPIAVAKLITDFKDSEMNGSAFRTGVVNFWKEKFENDLNYSRLNQIIT